MYFPSDFRFASRIAPAGGIPPLVQISSCYFRLSAITVKTKLQNRVAFPFNLQEVSNRSRGSAPEVK